MGAWQSVAEKKTNVKQNREPEAAVCPVAQIRVRVYDSTASMNSTRIIGRHILRCDRVTSTNDRAREFAAESEPEGLVITAEEQTAGRGRMGRQWHAPPRTSIQLSLLLRPPLAPHQAPRLTAIAALALTAALRAEWGLTPTLKWHNDVLLHDKKCAGILVETAITGDALSYAIVGIGVNVNFSMPAAYPDLAPFATTLADELGHAVDRAALERALLERLDAYYARLRAGEDFLDEYRAHLSTLGRAVRAETPWGIEEGIAEDVDLDGALCLRCNGKTIKLIAGDVTLLKDQV